MEAIRMQRILHVNDYPANMGGGAEIMMRRTIELQRRCGLSVDAFTSADLPQRNRTPLAYLHNTAACRALADRLDAFGPDVVHLHNYYHVLSPGILGVLAAAKGRRRLRVVMTTHDFHLVCPNAGGNWFRHNTGLHEAIETGSIPLPSLLTRRWDHRGLAHSLLKAAQHGWNYRWQHLQSAIDLLICPSRFVRDMMAPTGLPSCWLPHPAPVMPSVPSRRPKWLSLVFAGRIEPEKGLHGFLRKLPVNYPATLTIIGAGSQLARCQDLCIRRGLMGRTEFVGRLSHEETLARIASCHVLVQPSHMLETYGLGLIEALTLGTNVLACDRGASPEIVADAGAGFVFDVNSRASLLAALDAIRHRHAAGTLNGFDLTVFLRQRSETAHIDALLRLYESRDQVMALAG
jgi:glycosyltransferase involved in cell wall biosynthesis